MGISIKRLTPVFAGEVTGVDCKKPLSPDEVVAIHAGMNEYAILVFRDQKLTDEEQLQFTLHFGEIEKSRGRRPGRTVVSWGGNTEFADMRAAYDALDHRLKREIEDLVCLHSNLYSRGKLGVSDFSEEELHVFKPVRQRLVR